MTPPDERPTPSRTERRQSAGSRRRVVIGAAAAVALVAAGATYWLTYDGTAKPAADRPPPTTTPSTAPVAAAATVVATTKVPELTVYAGAEESGEPVAKLTDRTEYGLPRTLMVIDQQPGWFQTLLPIRPNGSKGWVKESDVTLTSTNLRVEIDLKTRYLVLFDGDKKVLDTAVAIGKDETPTPPGTYYVTDPVDLTSRPNGAYGAYALGISGFSEVLKSFRGGPGQLAVHGTANPADLGQPVSNGCIRIPNDKVLELAALVPLGTPVVIK